MQEQTPKEIDLSPYEAMRNAEIRTELDADRVASVLGELVARKKELKKQRDEIIGPLRQGISAYNEKEKAVLEPIEALETILRGKVVGWAGKMRARRLEASQMAHTEQLQELKRDERIAIDRCLGSHSPEDESWLMNTQKAIARMEMNPPEIDETIRAGETTVSIVRRWKWKITDSDRVPKEYLTLDEKKINAVVRSQKENTDIPGIEVYQEETTSVRTE